MKRLNSKMVLKREKKTVYIIIVVECSIIVVECIIIVVECIIIVVEMYIIISVVECISLSVCSRVYIIVVECIVIVVECRCIIVEDTTEKKIKKMLVYIVWICLKCCVSIKRQNGNNSNW